MSPESDAFEKSAKYIEKLYLNESFWDNNKTFCLLLDYDGTLSPIAPHPDQTLMSPGNREALEFIISQPNVMVAIITGRDALNAKSVVALENVTYAGNHGFEIHFADGFIFNYELNQELKENYPKMVQELNEISHDGAWVEDKKYSLTFHFRAVPAEYHKELINKSTEIIRKMGFRPSPAHMAVEAKPPMQWNKGYAAEYILKHKFGENWQEKAIVLFMGDDTTDEDVMRVLQGRSLTFRVTANPDLESCATHKIPDTKTVTNILQQIQKRLSRRTPIQ
uniref:Trehalose 6-phosphate phosphatase n=1 Tax=Culicoides sonorensis TaxID=179676 RepID=A0A336L967_CULSO